MKLNWQVIGTLFRVEVRMVLRDRRILITSILLPLLVTPLLLLASTWSIRKRERTLEQTPARYAITGSQAETVQALAEAARKLPPSGTNQAAGARFNFIEVAFPGRAVPSQPTETNSPLSALHRGDLELVLEGLAGVEYRAETNHPPEPAGSPQTSTQTNSTPPGKRLRGRTVASEEKVDPQVPVVRIVYRGDRDQSVAAMNRMQEVLTETRRGQRAGLLHARQFPIPIADAAKVKVIDLASGAQVAGLALGRMVTLFALMFILMGGAVVATDSLAGEKERGTLETLLTTSARRIEILAAKHLVIVALGLMITLIQALNLLFCVGFKLLPVPMNLAGAVTPWTTALLFLLFLPMASLAANVLLLVSGVAKSYKEAQLYFFPIFLLGLVPALAPLMPVPLRSAIVVVPVANLGIAAKEILIGTYDWPMIVLSWVITAGAAVWTSRMGVRVLSSERLISANEVDAVQFGGGPALFERHVLRWFAVLWALLMMLSSYTQTADLRVQLAFNLLGLFFGACCLMMWKYRLNPVEALALRRPKPAIWLAVLLGVPGGLLATSGLFRLTSSLLPVPEKMMEGFERSLLPEGVPVGQLLFFMTVLPGIFEELTFRGLLLHGLRRRFHPATTALVVGIMFGLFHIALFRLVPTAVLGVMFAAMTMLTGSIFPAMLWHALSNGLGILLHLRGMPLNELDAQGYLCGTGLLAAAFWIAWRNRTPYPGLKAWHRSSGR